MHSLIQNAHYLITASINLLNWPISIHNKISEDHVTNIKKNLDLNKAHDYDHISICMLNICGKNFCKPLKFRFCECLNKALYSLEWKNSNLVPVYRKGDNQWLKNYRAILLLQVCCKTFTKLIFKKMFKFFNKNSSVSPNILVSNLVISTLIK